MECLRFVSAAEDVVSGANNCNGEFGDSMDNNYNDDFFKLNSFIKYLNATSANLKVNLNLAGLHRLTTIRISKKSKSYD